MASAIFGDKSGPGGIVHNPASPFAQEMARWEMGWNPYGKPGRPREQVTPQEYPAMFYKMKRSDMGGGFEVVHYLEAADETEACNLLSRGYHQGREAAIAAVEAAEQGNAIGAAERAYTDRRMSDAAQAEARAADDATGAHLADVPITPINRQRGVDRVPSKSDLVKAKE